MATDPAPKDAPQPLESPLQPERPVAEPEPLTVTVIEPVTVREVAAPAPPATTVREPLRIARIPVPRWYWALVVVAVSLVMMDYRYVWAPRIQKFLEHRVLPARIVRYEHSIWRHTFGEPKGGGDSERSRPSVRIGCTDSLRPRPRTA
jgi:hypothetical protein